jgi:hypothetical protein
MKTRIALLTASVCLAILPVTFAQETATLRYDGGFDGTAAMPRSYPPDEEGGIERFPDPNLNFIIQYGMRFTPLEAGLLRNINFWVEEILTRGVADSTISYHGPQIAFDWPFPFNTCSPDLRAAGSQVYIAWYRAFNQYRPLSRQRFQLNRRVQ